MRRECAFAAMCMHIAHAKSLISLDVGCACVFLNAYCFINEINNLGCVCIYPPKGGHPQHSFGWGTPLGGEHIEIREGLTT